MTIETTTAMPAAATSGATGAGTASGPTADQLAAGLHGTDLAVAAGLAIAQLRNEFSNIPSTGFAGAAITGLPLLLLNSPRQASGLMGIVSNPKFLGAAALTGIVLIKDMSQGRGRCWVDARFVRVERELAVGNQSKFCLDRFDDSGASAPAIAEDITFTSSASHVLEVDKHGVVTARAPGTATITASINNDKSDLVTVRVTEESRPEARHPTKAP
jgi:Bacterial Ig-like domain (group 2)